MEFCSITLTDYPKLQAFWLKNNMKIQGLYEFHELEAFIKINVKTCFYLEDNKEVIGIVLAGFDGRTCNVYHVFVDEEKRRLGFGTKMMHHLKESVQSMHGKQIQIVYYASAQFFEKFLKENGYQLRNDKHIFELKF